MLFKIVLGKLDICWGVHRVYEWVQLVTKHYKVTVTRATSLEHTLHHDGTITSLHGDKLVSCTLCNSRSLPSTWNDWNCGSTQHVTSATRSSKRLHKRMWGTVIGVMVSTVKALWVFYSPTQWKLKDAKLSYWICVWYLMRTESVSLMCYQRQNILAHCY